MSDKHKLQANALTVTGRRKPRQTLLHEVSMTVESGQVVAIVGPNGAGKSTLVRALLGLVKIDSGQVLLDGETLDNHSLKRRAQALAWLPQLSHTNSRLSVSDYLLGSRFRFSEPRPSTESAIHQALGECGVAHLAQRTVDSLSGGELQRILFAGCLAQESAFLILDEPGNHLDPTGESELLTLITHAVNQQKGVVIVTHNINLLHQIDIKDRQPLVMGMSGGRLQFQHSLDDAELGKALSKLYGLHFERVTIHGQPYFLRGSRHA